MKVVKLTSFGVATILAALTMPAIGAENAASDFIIFDAPHADTTGDYNGTFPSSINDWGVITGYYIDTNNVYHGFFRSPDGRVTGFQVPGADTTDAYAGTAASSINDLGEITGNYTDSMGVTHGFLRSAEGRYTKFDVPDAAGYTNPIALNLEGTVVGTYVNAQSEFRAFIRRTDGTFVTFSGPDACQMSPSAGCYGSAAFNINIFGVVAAAYEDNRGNFVNRGLVRSPDGKLTAFEAPGSGNGSYQGTGCPGCALGLNASGTIAGTYTDSENVFHGFLRSPEGTYTTFEVPNAGNQAFQGTGCFSDCNVSVNDSGEMTGTYIDSSNNSHGYLRSRDGKFTTVDPRGSVATAPEVINELGVITGFYLDAQNVVHGFLRIPSHLR